MNTPKETFEKVSEAAKRKIKMGFTKTLILAVAAGAFIAFAASASSTAIHLMPNTGLAKSLAGALFATGLMMVVFFGAELFTGNMLITISVLKKESKLRGLTRNWMIVYLGNLIGSLIIAFLIFFSKQGNMSDGALGAFTIKTALAKVQLDFIPAVALGILCNWLVCMAVWMAFAAKDATGKIWGIFFPIWIFITMGLEHSVANMYYIPAGILLKSDSKFVGLLMDSGISEQALAGLNWGSFLYKNLLPVTLGNIIGGAVFVAMFAFIAYKKD